jgi:hypothetical protein
VNSSPEQMNPTSMANMPNQPSSRPNAQVGSYIAIPQWLRMRCGEAARAVGWRARVLDSSHF